MANKSLKLVLVLAIVAAATLVGHIEGRNLKSEPAKAAVGGGYHPQTIGIFAPPGSPFGFSPLGPGFSFGTPGFGSFPGVGRVPGPVVGGGGGLPGVGGGHP
ncbi:hypothetical protein QJS10_CPB04g01073 [Acorus calamus]|uniref:Glycine-rich protein n=1 Tax=Acorus calamus TaxID=4465 RepID=A0AAV9F302_ACOCL|nr:hypothetical protein QJS10_CPB04g01073 [Acorus calamus]